MGNGQVIPYMESLGLMPADSLTYIIASHQHSDHIAGLTETMNGGYDVSTAVYYNGSNYNNSYTSAFFNAASQTSAGPARALPLGTVIQLGDSATATCVCVDGTVIGHGYVNGARNNENDRSIGLLIKYGSFEYLFAGDLGGGDDDYACTYRSTNQVNIETHLAQAIMPGGEHPLLTADGLEVLHVNHHGSESSMNSDLMNLMTPAFACIATGSGQSPDYMFPRHDVVDNVLLSGVYCVSAEAAIVLQNEEGYPAGNQTSYSGYCIGDIIIKTSGVANYAVDGSGEVTQGPDERSALGLPITVPFEGASPDYSSPLVQAVSPNGGEQWVVNSLHDVTWNAFDTVGVASYAIDYSTNSGANWLGIVARTNGNPGVYAWTIPSTVSNNCLVKVTAWDAAGNSGLDISDGPFAIIPSNDSGSPVVTLLAPNGGEMWFSGEIDTIRWQATDDIGIAAYSLSYTTNGGGSWNSILPRTNGNPGVYAWTVPNLVTSNCKVRVLCWDDVQHLGIDMSDAPFRIHFPDSQGPTVDIVLPDGGEVWTANSSRYIFWSASDTSGIDSVAIQYSPDNGDNWAAILPFTHNNPGFYEWLLGDTPARESLIRVIAKDLLGNIGHGVSQSVFTIRKSPSAARYFRVSPTVR